MNLFEQAIEKKELVDFALGKNEYFAPDRDYGDHSILISWTNNILPLIEFRGIDYLNEKIKEMMLELLESEIPESVKNECLLYHLHVYYYLASEGRIKADDLSPLNQRFLKSLNNYVFLLRSRNDTKASAIENAINLIKLRGGLITKSI